MEKLKIKYITRDHCHSKSVKFTNPYQSVIQKSYDIVKAHKGEIKVLSKEGEGSDFEIRLPIVHRRSVRSFNDDCLRTRSVNGRCFGDSERNVV